MSHLPGSSESRRDFLKEIAIASAALGAGLASPVVSAARPKAKKPGPKPPAERPAQLKLGFGPDPFAAGAVLVLTSFGDFATFPALAKDKSGAFGRVGTAIIQLIGCQAKTFTYSTADTFSELPRFYGDLDPGSIYEIKNSAWVTQVTENAASLTVDVKGPSKAKQRSKPKTRPLKHFVFTFFETTFQCVAEGLRSEIRTDPFGLIASDLEHEGLGD